ncbi:peptidase A1 family protein [Abortiporus biennis]
MFVLTTLSVLLGQFIAAAASDPTWISLNLSTLPSLTDVDLNVNSVDLLIGTPPQRIPLPIDLQSDLTGTIYSSDCPFCSGDTFFDSKKSSTYLFNHTANGTTAQLAGSWITDTVGFGGILSSPNIDLVMVEKMSTNITGWRFPNGLFGFLTTSLRAKPINHIFTELYKSGQLLNPVVGLRLDPLRPRMTIGALDPNDYQGMINWVQIEENQPDYTQYNLIQIDGVKGRNGSFLPFGSMLAGMDSTFKNIAIPDNFTYFLQDGYSGPIYNNTSVFDPSTGQMAYPCINSNLFPGQTVPPAYADFSVSINGVTYMIDSANNLVRPNTIFAPKGACNVGITSNSVPGKPDTVLGLPFLRSVYLAFRFPTDNCPGYYGFAFPSGANRTQAQLDQKPTSTPTASAQCLVLTAPTSTPTATLAVSSQKTYAVYGAEDIQVPLTGVDLLAKGVWNATN